MYKGMLTEVKRWSSCCLYLYIFIYLFIHIYLYLFIHIYLYIFIYTKDKIRVFSMANSKRPRGNAHKLQQQKSWPDIRKTCFTRGLFKHYNKLTRYTMESLSLEILKFGPEQPNLWAKDCAKLPPEFLARSNCSMIVILKPMLRHIKCFTCTEVLCTTDWNIWQIHYI